MLLVLLLSALILAMLQLVLHTGLMHLIWLVKFWTTFSWQELMQLMVQCLFTLPSRSSPNATKY